MLIHIFRESHKQEGYKTRIKSHKKKAMSFYQLFYQGRISKENAHS
jgi:hypothetical protein